MIQTNRQLQTTKTVATGLSSYPLVGNILNSTQISTEDLNLLPNVLSGVLSSSSSASCTDIMSNRTASTLYATVGTCSTSSDCCNGGNCTLKTGVKSYCTCSSSFKGEFCQFNASNYGSLLSTASSLTDKLTQMIGNTTTVDPALANSAIAAVSQLVSVVDQSSALNIVNILVGVSGGVQTQASFESMLSTTSKIANQLDTFNATTSEKADYQVKIQSAIKNSIL